MCEQAGQVLFSDWDAPGASVCQRPGGRVGVLGYVSCEDSPVGAAARTPRGYLGLPPPGCYSRLPPWLPRRCERPDALAELFAQVCTCRVGLLLGEARQEILAVRPGDVASCAAAVEGVKDPSPVGSCNLWYAARSEEATVASCVLWIRVSP